MRTSLIFLMAASYPMGFPRGAVVKNPPANAGDTRDMGLIPGSGRCPGGGNGNPLQYSCQANSMERRTWQATVHGVVKSQTRLSTHKRSYSIVWRHQHNLLNHSLLVDIYIAFKILIFDFRQFDVSRWSPFGIVPVWGPLSFMSISIPIFGIFLASISLNRLYSRSVVETTWINLFGLISLEQYALAPAFRLFSTSCSSLWDVKTTIFISLFVLVFSGVIHFIWKIILIILLIIFSHKISKLLIQLYITTTHL